MTIFFSREAISIYPPRDVPMQACVGTTAIFPQLLSSGSSLPAAVSRRRLRGEGLKPCSSSAPGQHRPVLLPRAPSRAPQAAGSDLQCRLKPALLPPDSLAGSCRPPGSSGAAIKHPGDLAASTDNSGCRLRLDGSCLYPARHPDKPRQPPSPFRPVC